MAPKFDRISDIVDINQTKLRLLVRILRKWCVTNPNNKDKVYCLELVLMDNTGDRIGVFIREPLIYIYDKQLQEEQVYLISKFKLISSSGDYKSTKNSFKVSFEKDTDVVKQPMKCVPQAIYHFTPPQEIFSSDFDCNYFVDIMGVLTGVGNVKEYEKNQKKSKLIDIELQNEGYRFKVTLFAGYVDELEKQISSGEPSNMVVVLLFAKVKSWNHIKNVNTTFGSKVMFNPEIPEVLELKQRMGNLIETPNKGLTQLQDRVKISEEDDFIKSTKNATLQAMKKAYLPSEYNASNEGLPFVVLATIVSFEDDVKWYYQACNICIKKATPDSDEYYCPRCKIHVKDVTPKYFFRLRIEDNDLTSATFVMFDRDAEILLEQSCAKLLQTIDQRGDSYVMPDELCDLLGKEYLFKVGCDVGSGSRFESSYIVKRVTNRSDIIQSFKDLKISQGSQQTPMTVSTVSAVTNPAVVDDVAQDLIEKFNESHQSFVDGLGSVTEVVDLSSESPCGIPNKRSSPINDELPSSKFMKKDIKKEKE